jgi:hypothetical protein
MIIQTTTDPMTLNEVASPESRPCLFEGDGDNGLVIYFESEETRQDYIALTPHDPKVWPSNDTEDYVAEG